MGWHDIAPYLKIYVKPKANVTFQYADEKNAPLIISLRRPHQVRVRNPIREYSPKQLKGVLLLYSSLCWRKRMSICLEDNCYKVKNVFFFCCEIERKTGIFLKLTGQSGRLSRGADERKCKFSFLNKVKTFENRLYVQHGSKPPEYSWNNKNTYFENVNEGIRINNDLAIKMTFFFIKTDIT